MTLKTLTAVVAVSAAILGAPAHAAVVFQDNFDADSGASVLNFNSLISWTVGGGSIDYIRSGGFGIACVGGAGGCLDMDGSTSNAGRITSRAVYDFVDGVTYTFQALVSGNQRGGAQDSITMGLIDTATSGEVSLTFTAIAPGDPFSPRSVAWSGSSFTSTYRLFIEGIGGDNFGAIVDDVVLRDNTTTTVPEPTTLLLSGIALLAAGAVRRRAGRSASRYFRFASRV